MPHRNAPLAETGRLRLAGRKRHLVTDCLGLLLDVLVTSASTTDRDAVRTMLHALRGSFRRLQLVWADDDYNGHTGHLVDWADPVRPTGSSRRSAGEGRPASVVGVERSGVRAVQGVGIDVPPVPTSGRQFFLAASSMLFSASSMVSSPENSFCTAVK
ncbi:transposase [Streptomyces yanii]|uniref:Transposase n=1 Tax=Streptomyces yanii TaxID=78510 RepID=A0ABV5R7U6_9ACTN